MPVLRYIAIVLGGLLAYFGFGYLMVGRYVFRGTWLVGAVVISTFILLGPVLQGRLRRRTIATHPRCGQCGYNLTGHADLFESQEAVCPECGERIAEANVIASRQPDEKQLSGMVEKLAAIGAITGTVAMLGFALLLAGKGELRQHLWIMAVGVLGFWVPLAIVYWRKRNMFRPGNRP